MSTTYTDTSSPHNSDPAELGTPAHGVRTFVIVAIGQVIAVTGLTIFNFAVAYYVYPDVPTLWIVGIVYALPFLAFLVASPFAGSLIDRWGPRRALLVSNVGGIVLTATVVVLPFTHGVSMVHGFVIVTAVPFIKALLLPAFESAVPFLVPKRHIGRANGTRMLVNGAGAALGPVAAALLLDSVGIWGVVVLVVVTLIIGVLTLLAVRIPQARQEVSAPASLPVLLAEFRQAWRYTVAKQGLVSLLAFFGVVSLGIGFVEVLLPRLVLAFADADALTLVLLAGVVGMAGFGIAMTIWGGPRNRVAGTLGYTMLFAGAMVVGALRPNVMLLAVAAFFFLGSTSIILGNVHTILHTKVEPPLMGRVMALKNAVYSILLMVGDILAGLTSAAAQPLVGADRVNSRAVALVVGDGPGRGFAVLMLAMGVLIILCTVYAHRYPRLRNLNEALPDVTPEDLASAAARR